MQIITISASNSICDTLTSLSCSGDEIIQINLSPGTYHEKVTINRSNIILNGTGSTPSDTIIEYDDFAFDIMPDGTKRGTFRSYTLFIDASNVTLKNLTVTNSSGSEFAVGQAIALYSDGDRLTFENCRFTSRQDTIFTGPLPPKELQPGGFIGPKQYAPRINGHQLFHNCYICGNIDFIFGSATAYFDCCTIESLSHGEEAVQGYVTAPSTPANQAYGYVFSRCSFISSQCPPQSCYLARPWREYAQAVFIDCNIGPHIHPDGFHDWNKTIARDTIFFATHNCITPENHPYFPTAPFAKTIDNNCISIYNKLSVLE